jgi:predicted nucleic acid-binding protein
MSSNFTVVFDACVLYPFSLRDILMQLSSMDIFRAKWTNKIHDEWMRNLLIKDSGIERERLERTRDLMNKAIPDCLVEGYQGIISSLELPDPDDRHVLAAAIASGADEIVTYNLKDFPKDLLTPYYLEARHPDEFLNHCYDLSPTKFVDAIRLARARLKNPPFSQEDYLISISKLSLPKTITLLHRNLSSI